ncbi:DNA-directed RNA polymerases I, II, and III subunit RPABC1 [Frankliniella fusca]|uniref:DNA-directed RNA polymerases I, II, and III subunit RPABC1 n=1 Tax=Frankliniella fusca TaxID=407009 RepID=A0AAE1I4L5_9NEOP|nr:DNA-directed RNA polymerases I, II, and III subunit RPABC1 [Frankliniella fusca]
MTEESDFKKLWRVKKTIMQLCHDRGYLVTQEELDETVEDFKSLYEVTTRSDKPLRARMTMLFTHSKNNDEKMYVFFPVEKAVRKADIIVYCQDMQRENVFRGIFVVQDALTTVAKKAIADFAPTFRLEAFWESELLVNIMDHELVPQHIVLSDQEKEELFSKYKITENLLMRIQSHDPVVRYYGLKRGQVIKIIRNSETAGRYVLYRIVC